MITLKLKDKATFFDRDKVIKALDRAERRYLSKAGAFVRKRARSSMRKRKRSAPPGQPPSAHTGDLRRILFALELVRKAVIIGPIGFNGSKVPAALEYGGTVEVLKDTGGRVVRTRSGRNQYGEWKKEIRVGGRKQRVEVPLLARPFMGPALAKELPNLPRIWQNSVKG